MILTEWRTQQARQLKKISDTPELDADLILAHVLKKSRTALMISTETLSDLQERMLQKLITRRLKGEPVAYLVSHQPFWTLDLLVTKDTLIPRPETECLIDWILQYATSNNMTRLADLGTGSGAIALALAKEKPSWSIIASDISEEALSVAKQNAEAHHIDNIIFRQGNWTEALLCEEAAYDLIASNPPYVAEADAHLSQLSHEPRLALVSGKDGLRDLRLIIPQALQFLKTSGVLIVEHGFDQARQVVQLFEAAGYQESKTYRDLADLPRFTVGKK